MRAWWQAKLFWYKNPMASETTQNAVFERVQAIMAEVFEVDVAEISPQTEFGDLPKWDSMGHMDLMVALESHFGVAISAETIRELVSVTAILEQIGAGQNG